SWCPTVVWWGRIEARSCNVNLWRLRRLTAHSDPDVDQLIDQVLRHGRDRRREMRIERDGLIIWWRDAVILHCIQLVILDRPPHPVERVLLVAKSRSARGSLPFSLSTVRVRSAAHVLYGAGDQAGHCRITDSREVGDADSHRNSEVLLEEREFDSVGLAREFGK